MPYTPTNFSTTAVINADTLFQNYDDEVQVLMSDVGNYLTEEMVKVYTETGTIVTDGIKVNSVETIEDLATQDGVVFPTIIVKDLNRGGTFEWSATGIANGGTVFAGATGYWNRQYSSAVNVKWFGAVGDNSNDDTAAVQEAINYCESINQKLAFPAGDYKTSQTIVISNCDIEAYSATIYPDGSVVNGVEVGTEVTIFQKSIMGLSVRGVGKDLAPVGGSGIKYINCSQAYFENITASRFPYCHNVEPADATRIAYCTWISPYGHRGDINFRVYVDTLTGFAAHNKVFSGRFQMSTVDTAIYHIYGLRTNTSASMNDWHFYAPSAESYSGATTPVNAFRLINADYWTIHSPRTEGDWSEADVYIGGGSKACLINMQYDDGSFTVIDASGSCTTNYQKTTSVGTFTNNTDAGTTVVKSFQRLGGSATVEVVGSDSSGGSLRLGINANRDIATFLLAPATPSLFTRIAGANILETLGTAFRPAADNTISLGSPSRRWSSVYSTTSTINTSDDREKTYINIEEVEKQVAIELKTLMKKFKFNLAIKEKGEENARIHFGTSAQSVKEVFEKHGLNAMDYALICYDEWKEQEEVKDEEGNIIEPYRPAGDMYGIRYEELLCFIISAM